jgi:hypothetical protein
MGERRPLTQAESAVLVWVIDHIDIEGIDDLRAQVAHLEVTAGTTPCFLNLEVNDSAPRWSITTSPLPVRVIVGAPGAEAGEMLVWVESGYLSALEYAWYTDEMPDEWPDVESLRLG